MLFISSHITLPDHEIEISAIRSRGAGGQNVNKLATAIHLRFDVQASSLPAFYKQRLLTTKDQRLNKDGIIVIKAQQYRSQEQNRAAALLRLEEMIRTAGATVKKRKPTRPTRASQKKRLERKTRHGRQKALRCKNQVARDE